MLFRSAVLPELRYDCGLATMSLLAGDVTGQPLTAEHGTLPVRAAVADPERMSAWESDPAPWVARMLAAAEFLGSPGPSLAVLPASGPPG